MIASKKNLREKSNEYSSKTTTTTTTNSDAELLQAKIRAGILQHGGTDLERNDHDPCGDGDQSEIRGSYWKLQFYRGLFAQAEDIPIDALNPLASAVVRGQVNIVKGLLQLADKPNKTPDMELIPLLECREPMMRRSPLLLLVSLGKHRPLNLNDSEGANKLQSNHVKIAKLLLRYGARPDARDLVGKTVCHYGAGAKATAMTLQVVDMCMKAAESAYMFGKQVRLHGLKDESMNGLVGIARGFQVDSGRRAVHVNGKNVAIKPENLRMVDDVGSRGKAQNFIRLCDIQDRLGSTSLHEVFIAERVDVAKWLLERNVKLDLQDCDGFSPLNMALTSAAQMSNRVAHLIKEASLRYARNERLLACTNCGAQESDSVALSLCSACKVPRYCSKECQLAHWKASHKAECRKQKRLQDEGVVLERPPSPPKDKESVFFTLSHDRRTTSEGGTYTKPGRVKVGEKFTIKVQALGTRSNGTLLIYDKSRECMIYMTASMHGFAQLFDAVRAEKATNGTKTYMKAMFDDKGNCMAFPKATCIKTTW